MIPYGSLYFQPCLSHTFIVYYCLENEVDCVLDVVELLYDYPNTILSCKCLRSFETSSESILDKRCQFFVVRHSNNRSSLGVLTLREEYQVRDSPLFDFHNKKIKGKGIRLLLWYSETSSNALVNRSFYMGIPLTMRFWLQM